MAASSLLVPAGAPLNSFQMNTPQKRADHRRALAQAVGERRPGRRAGDDAEAHADVPDHAAEDADEVQTQRCPW